jgi:hypothetical protein
MTSDIIKLLEINALKSNVAHKISVIITYRNKIVSIGYNRNLKISSSNHDCLLRG